MNELAVVLRAGAQGPSARMEQLFRTSEQDLWEALTDPARVSRWMAPTTLHGAPGVGVRYTIDFGADHSTSGEVVRCEAPRVLEVSWELPGEPDTVVRLEVAAAVAGARLVLTHSRLPVNQAHGYAAGWQAHVAGLAALVEGTPPPDWDETFARLLARYQQAYADLGM